MRARRTDDNQTEIVAALRKSGMSVHCVNGVFDLLIAYAGHTVCVEVKHGSKSPSRRKLTQDAEEFRSAWKGEYVIVNDVDEAMTLANRLRDRRAQNA